MTPERRLYRFGAIACGVLALVPGYYAVTLEWAPRVDFDVTGVLFIMQNGPRLLAWGMTAALGFWAVYLGIRASWR